MEAEKPQVVVVGNIGIDTNVYFQGNGIDFNVEANFTRNLDMVGQAGGYATRGYTHLGHKTSFIGYIGSDFMGRHIRSVLEQEGVCTDGLMIDPEGTSRSINFMYPDGRRKNFYDGKGHMHLVPPVEKCSELLTGARLVHFNIPNWARLLLPLARQAGARVACDIQDMVDIADPYRLDFVRSADYLFFSAANHADPVPLVRKYLELNPGLIIVSGMGADGCLLGTKDGIAHYPAIEMDLPVVDTNGAGDALAVGFLSSHVLQNLDLERSVRRGQIAARYKCAQKASSDRMITSDLLDHYEEVLP